ncbi:MAG TPA: hypothetical protein VFQ39_03385, partial [Longimicrobium sp.]|nr:hypothetical protein [Longimicrobium sp.]
GESAPAPERGADDPFTLPDAAIRFLEAIGPPGQERLRKLDALAGLRTMLTARAAVPGWWYALRERVEGGDI